MIRKVFSLIADTFRIWGEAKASRMSAALTYYTMLSLAPLLTMAIAIAGYIFGDQLAESEIIENVELFTTETIAQTVASLIKNATQPESGLIAGTISISILVFAASGVFTQLYETFNEIWQVPREVTSGFLFSLRARLFGIVMVLIAGVGLLIALILSSAVGSFNEMIAESYPVIASWMVKVDLGLTYLLVPLIFSLTFWLLPACKVSWHDAWPAGILTAVLFASSRYLIQAYLQFSTTSEVYGAAGSLVVLLIWIYITGMVIFLGASFSHAWSITFGTRSRDTAEATKEADALNVEMDSDLDSKKSVEPSNADPARLAKTKAEKTASQGATDEPFLEPRRRG